MNTKLRESLAWYGVCAILGAYTMSSLSILPVDNPLILTLNLTGSLTLINDAWYQKNYQPVVINIVWAAIAIISLVRVFI